MLGYMLIAIGILSMFASYIGNTGRVNTTYISSQAVGAKIINQVHVITSELIACTTMYPGNNGTAYRFTLPAAATAKNISALTCPGKQAGNNNLFGSLDAASLPMQLNEFSPWQFVNDATSARLILTANNASHATDLSYAAPMLGTAAAVSGNVFTFTYQN